MIITPSAETTGVFPKSRLQYEALERRLKAAFRHLAFNGIPPA